MQKLIFAVGLIFSMTFQGARGDELAKIGPPMRVAIVRGGFECPTKCVEWISLDGFFVKQSPALFRQALERIGRRNPPVLISSGGGNIDAAMEMGRMLHAKGLDVTVARTVFDQALTKPPSGKAEAVLSVEGAVPTVENAFCASACTLLLAAGKARHVQNGVRVGLHELLVPEQDAQQQLRHFETRTLTKDGRVISKETRLVKEETVIRHVERHKSGAEDYRDVVTYLDSFGLPSAQIVALMHRATPEHIAWLSRQGLADTGLATDAQSPEVVLGLVRPAVVAAPATTGAPVLPAPAEPPGPLAIFAQRLGMSIPQLFIVGALMLAMGSSIVFSFRRSAGWGRSDANRQEPRF